MMASIATRSENLKQLTKQQQMDMMDDWNRCGGNNAIFLPEPTPILFENAENAPSLLIASAITSTDENIREAKTGHVMYITDYPTSDYQKDGVVYEHFDFQEKSKPSSLLELIRYGVQLYTRIHATGKALMIQSAYGVGRSSTVVIGILMSVKGFTVEEALEYLRRYHKYGSTAYVDDLLEFEQEIASSASASPSASSSS